jgi:hypothetical protein
LVWVSASEWALVSALATNFHHKPTDTPTRSRAAMRFETSGQLLGESGPVRGPIDTPIGDSGESHKGPPSPAWLPAG